MALPKTNHHLLPLLATITILFLTLFSKSISATDNFTEFTFSNFDSPKLILQGDATLSSTKTVQLTKTYDNGNPKKNSVGRVVYASPVHLWDNSSGYTQVSSFETTFKFVITSPTREVAGDGITFFIAPVDSTIPKDSDGGFFGLFENNTLGSSVEVVGTPYHIVAVEFDNYVDGRWDPKDPHIGIDVNTVRSRATIRWNRISGKEFTVKIEYNTRNEMLYVTGSYPNGDQYKVSSSIDLAVVLPEYVWVGFSASTGDSAVETHSINYWYFSAWLHNVTSLTTEEDINNHAPRYVLYGLLIIFLFGLIIFFVVRKKKKKMS